MVCFHNLLSLLRFFLGYVVKHLSPCLKRSREAQELAGGRKGRAKTPQDPLKPPALSPPGCPWGATIHGLGETHQDKSMGETFPRSLHTWGEGMSACRYETQHGMLEKSILDGIFKGGNKGGEKEGSKGSGEEQA